MPSLILGLVGLSGCGKGTVARILEETYQARLFKFSAILGDILDQLALEKTREHFIHLSETLRGTFGEQVLAYAVAKNVVTSDADIVVVDGFRRVEDLVAFEALPQFYLIEITAPEKIRFERMKQRGEKAGEMQMTWEHFLEEEQAPTEITIPAVMARADLHLDNSQDLANLEAQIQKIMNAQRTT